MSLAIVLSIALVLTTVAMHYEALRLISGLIPKLVIPPRSRLLVVLTGAMLAHIAEICVYAVAYYAMQTYLELGTLGGELEGNVVDYYYFSAAMYTTLGTGDIVVYGPMRIIAGTQGVNGLVLIGWTASFTYLSMEKFWVDHRTRQRRD